MMYNDIGSSVLTNVPQQCKILTIGKLVFGGKGEYENSLYS